MARPTSSWHHKTLRIDAQEELRSLGQNLKVARERRKISITDLSKRLSVNPRVISKLEKGDPTVSLGALIQLLSVFGLLKGLAEFAAPENDIQETIIEARKFRGKKSRTKTKVFKDQDLDF